MVFVFYLSDLLYIFFNIIFFTFNWINKLLPSIYYITLLYNYEYKTLNVENITCMHIFYIFYI